MIDKAVLSMPAEANDGYGPRPLPQPRRVKEVEPPEWAPWGLLSAGAVIALYSLTLHRS